MFLHGEHNRLFMPEGSQLTYDYLVEKNGPDLYTRTSSRTTRTWTASWARTPRATSTRWSPPTLDRFN